MKSRSMIEYIGGIFLPALLIHYLCGDKMLGLSKNSDEEKKILKYRQVFNLGTQGPDIFFYHNAYPWIKRKSLNYVGEKLHDEKVNMFFKTALEYIKSINSESQNILTAYLCGYSCHYSLDNHTHPYIFYRTGFDTGSGLEHKKYSYYHRRFEAALDVLMMDKIYHKEARHINASKLINISKDEAEAIASMYHMVFYKVFNLDIKEEEIKKAIFHMIGVTAALRDTWGIKKKVIEIIERKSKNYPLISSLIYPIKIHDNRDYLNLKNSVWYYPWDNCNANKKSFLQMFEEAYLESHNLTKSVVSFIDNKISIDNTLDLIGNRSFSSGLDCDKDVKFKYFDCIFE